MTDVLIIGCGPSAISASLYLCRADRSVTLIAKDGGALEKAEKIENYYGLFPPVSGKELIAKGIEQAKALGATIVHDQVVSLGYTGDFQVSTPSQTFIGKALLFATGAGRTSPKIPNLVELEGKGVSYCAVCDAFFHRGKDVCVLGSKEYALHEAMELLPIARSVTLLTNGEELPSPLPENLKTNTTPIASLEGEKMLEKVIFQDGSHLPLSGLFVAVGVAGTTDLCRKIGVATDKNSIVVNQAMETNLPGIFAAGDCTGGLLQVSKAVSDGAIAGTSMIRYLRAQEKA